MPSRTSLCAPDVPRAIDAACTPHRAGGYGYVISASGRHQILETSATRAELSGEAAHAVHINPYLSSHHCLSSLTAIGATNQRDSGMRLTSADCALQDARLESLADCQALLCRDGFRPANQPTRQPSSDSPATSRPAPSAYPTATKTRTVDRSRRVGLSPSVEARGATEMVSGAISTGAVDGEGASPTASHSESETRLRDPSRRASVSRVSDDGPMIVPERPFLGCPVVGDLAQLEAEVAVLGIPHGVSYVVDDEQRGLATAPRQFGKRASSSPRT
jgi:hypothetical protein